VTHWGEIGGEHRDRLRVLMEHAGDAVAELAADRQILFVSSSFKGLLGYAEAELLGTDFSPSSIPTNAARCASSTSKRWRKLARWDCTHAFSIMTAPGAGSSCVRSDSPAIMVNVAGPWCAATSVPGCRPFKPSRHSAKPSLGSEVSGAASTLSASTSWIRRSRRASGPRPGSPRRIAATSSLW
jgi:PAS domain-containing protein